jgi:uncharacterized repeat protein (TIGR01451 family)
MLKRTISIQRLVHWLLAGSLLLLPLFHQQETTAATGVLYAAPSALGSGDCSSWDNACPLQTALASALSGDQIWVQSGVHKPGAARPDTFTLLPGVAVYGGFAGTETQLEQRDWLANRTVLSGDIDNNDPVDLSGVLYDAASIVGSNSFHVVSAGSAVTETARLDGFTITAGQANDVYPNDRGGGMFNDQGSPVLANLVFSGSAASAYGGGMYNYKGASSFSAVNFVGNQANGGRGGGLFNYQSSAMLERVAFVDNRANGGQGGGMHNYQGSLVIRQALFEANQAALGLGGGMNNESSSPLLVNVTFRANLADHGGGLTNEASSPTLVNVLFSGNRAVENGGGMNSHTNSSPLLINTTFSGNAGKDGGGLYNYQSSATLVNCLLWGDIPREIQNAFFSTTTVTYSNIQGGYSGTGNLNLDPLFVAPLDAALSPTTDGDYHVLPGSPVLDAGDNSAVPGGVLVDLDGKPRFIDLPASPDSGSGLPPLVDMGAYELSYADLALEKSVSAPAFDPGDPITFTLSISNTGVLLATQMMLTDTLPVGVVVNAVIAENITITDTGYTPAYVWMVQDLAPGQGGEITLQGSLRVPLAAGVYTNTAQVSSTSDALELNNQEAVTYTVANIAPSFTSSPLTSGAQGSLYSYAIATQDDNGDARTITASLLPAWLAFTGHGDGSASLSGTPSNANVGDHAVELQVTDPAGLSATQSYTLTIANVNDAPYFTSQPLVTVNEAAAYTYTITANDIDLIHGELLTITATTLPTWLVLSDNSDGSAALAGTPGAADVGDHPVALLVTDAGGLSASQPFTLAVIALPRYEVYLPMAAKGGP